MMRFVGTAFLLCALTACTEQKESPAPQSLTQLANFADRADIRAAMEAANIVSTGECKAANAQWLAEYRAPPKDGIIATLLSQPLSQDLAHAAQQSNGQLVQLMVMDKAGCLIAADAKTHDFEQSDETKFKETIGTASHMPLFEGSEHLPKGNIDQLSQALYDNKGNAIGVITLRWCSVKGGCA